MVDKMKSDLSKYRIESALELLNTAKANIHIDTKTSINRSYYAIFNSMRALLALDGYDSKKHSGVIAQFRKLYIKTEILPKSLSVTINDLFDIRNDCDYEDFFVVPKEDAQTQLENAEEFVLAVQNYLKQTNQ